MMFPRGTNRRQPPASASTAVIAGATLVVPLIAVLLIGPFAGRGARAEEQPSYPYIDGEVLIEVQNDYAFDSDDPDAELNDIFTTTEPVIRLHPFPGFYVAVHGVLEPVLPTEPRDDRIFDDHGLFAEELYAAYETDRFFVMGGKYTINFGKAWDEAPGIYGTDFAEDYELSERVGFGGGATFAYPGIGEATVSGSAFFLDTSILSQSGITNRGQTEISDGGPSNTEKPNSYALAVDGTVAALPGLAYHAAFVRQRKGRGDTGDETGLLVNAGYVRELGPVEIGTIVEYVHFDNADGIDGQTRHYLTTGLVIGWQNWNLSLSRTARSTKLADGSDTDDELIQVSAGYAFDFGLSVDVGYRLANESSVETDIFGVLLAYTYEF